MWGLSRLPKAGPPQHRKLHSYRYRVLYSGKAARGLANKPCSIFTDFASMIVLLA